MITEQWQDYGFEITNTKSKDISPNYLNYTLNLHNEPLYMFEYLFNPYIYIYLYLILNLMDRAPRQ
jgi:hypothetical protein